MRLATIGADDAVKQAHRVNRLHYVEAGKGALIQKHHAPIELFGGYQFPNAPQIEPALLKNVLLIELFTPPGDLDTVPSASSDPTPLLPASTEGDGLDIPDFLVRTQPEPPAAPRPTSLSGTNPPERPK
jgi:hypothetical protein